MKSRKPTIFRSFAIVIFSLIAILGLLFIIITYFSTSYYHQASTELLNKDVAAHIAEFTSPFNEKGLNRERADSVFKNAMILSPSSEVYFLDTTGKVIYFHASENEVREWNVQLLPVKKFITAKGEQYVTGIDPRDPQHKKIFSSAEVRGEKGILGYIYVILGSKKSEGIMDLIFGKHVLNLATNAFIIIIILSLFFSFLYLKRLRKNFNEMLSVLGRFENGDYNARFTIKKKNEMQPVAQAFNTMADLLTSTINKLKKTEVERKHFLASISHDLRTPLSIARGYTETLLLKRDNGDLTKEEQENFSQLIYNKMLQIENMVKGLFELSKMDAGEFRPASEPFVLSEILQETINTFQMIAAEKNIELKCVQCLYHVWVEADISMIERIIQNLVDNALKNTPKGGHVHAAIAVEGNELMLRIENDGEPLSEELLQWINIFSEENISALQRPHKSGLGLLIVQKILHLHNSSLRAEVRNHKNIFSFRLPVYSFPPTLDFALLNSK